MKFTERELKILNLLKEGKTQKEICNILGMSTATLNTDMSHICGLLGLANWSKISVVVYSATTQGVI